MSMETDFKINLTDLQLRNLAENIPPDKALELGLSLGLTKTELDCICHEVTDPVQTSFKVLLKWRSNLDPILIHWRNKVDGRHTERIKLETTLRENGLDLFIPCLDAHVTRKENDSNETFPTVNLSLPHGAHNADVIHEIEIMAVLSTEDDEINDIHKRLFKLLMQPLRSEHSWTRIIRVKALFEPHGKLTNIEMLPLCFSIDVFTLDGLNQLKRSIENGRLETELLSALFLDKDNRGFLSGLKLKLDFEKNLFHSGVRFFKDLNPTLSVGDSYSDMTDEGASQLSAQDFNVWTTRKTNTESSANPAGANMVWRNLSQHNFGF